MKITIIDHDMHFSNILLQKLSSNGYDVEYTSTLESIGQTNQSDIFLVSTDFSLEACKWFIEKFKEKTIILLASRYSDETVRFPLDHGADDFVVKPFRIEELERKIDYVRIKRSISSYQSYIKYSFEEMKGDVEQLSDLQPPLIIETNHITFIDKLIMEHCQRENKIFNFISLSSKEWKTKIIQSSYSHLLYISNLHLLNAKESENLFKILKNRKFILSTTQEVNTPYKTIKIDAQRDHHYDGSYIMSVEEYIQYIIKNFQHEVSDTELAKRLEFSRKTLYDRRNKYQIYKTKKGRMAS